jgi:DNA repair protein RecO (recombination protein O)
MGTFYLEEVNSLCVPFLDDKKRLACLLSICLLLHELLPERQIFPDLYHSVLDFLNNLSEMDFLKRYVLLEKELLSEIGFGLDTSCCAGGGRSDDLFYISPKTGRAVSREKGKPYHDKLLLLPRFLWCDAEVTDSDIQIGLKLTGYFLQTYALKKMLPKIREQLG